MEFLSEAWVEAMNDAASTVEVDPAIDLRIDYRAGDFSYRFVISGGQVVVTTDTAGDADLRISTDPSRAAGINAGERSALESFMSGDLVIGGDVQKIIEHQELLERLGTTLSTVGSDAG